MTYTAHIDSFAHENLPRLEEWPALIFELVGTASFVTKPEQYISDSVGPPPECCAAAGNAAIAKSVAVVSKPLSFIRTSDVSRSTSHFCGGGKTLSRRPGEV